MNSIISWPDNVWMGVSVENKIYISRIDCLRSTDARIKFLSIEPLLGPIGKMDLSDIDWVIVGGESGPRARPMKHDWVIEIRDQCVESNIPFFFKQWGGVHKKKAGRTLEGQTWNQMPVTSSKTSLSHSSHPCFNLRYSLPKLMRRQVKTMQGPRNNNVMIKVTE
jgi:protein gp37